MKKLTLLATAVVASLSMAGSAAAASYVNSSDDTIYTFGAPDTTSYGQVFTAPGGSLNSWSFYTQDSTSYGAKLVIANWDGSKAVGPALFDSLVQSVSASGGFFQHNYGGINLALNSGTSYIAYLTVAGVANPTPSIPVSGSYSSPLGGGFRFLNSNGTDPLTLNQNWSSWYIPNMQYAAVFGAVPEPATWAMMILGLGLVGGAMRRRQQASVNFAF